MSTSQDVKDAADAVATAKAAYEQAQAGVDAEIAAAVALIPTEQATYDAATLAYSNAFSAALATTNYVSAQATLLAAQATRDAAILDLVTASSSYDGQ